MFILFLKFTLIGLLIYKIKTEPNKSISADAFGSRCLIKNFKYSNEYLLSSRHDYELFYDEFDSYYKRKVFTNKIDTVMVKTLKQIMWILKPIDDKNPDTFFITNHLYRNENLCATHKHLEMFKMRRRVALISMNEKITQKSEKCMWKFTPVKINNIAEANNIYFIKNIHYNESLYAASYLFKSAIANARNVFTWHKKPDSTQFVWTLHCL